ncbi:WXG100 family type VII secretion target [[Mycobacterium] wendilense]|uniref:WXG100 family type VII secretion target n=1 Tax=[Mycobacterium] wendilense TaxID=3064284 RepID=A0ABN9P3F0_9MYCO|nr:WXG100 family type VII secretion target [Mycolicibacterium sp. MU0050]CAJ1586156.1 WXG100 family type VII secretion target [Mycolicibacterium sp. MU0050]
MAEPYGVDLDRMITVVEQMADYQRVVESMLDEVDTVVSNLHLNWDGAASRVHTNVHQQWRAGAEMMSQALEQLQQAAGHAHEAYSTAIESNRKIWA